MLRRLLLIMLWFAWAPALEAAVPVQVLVSWTARTETDLASYKVYAGTGATCGPGSASVIGQVSHPTTTLTTTFTLNAPATYLFCVTAVDTSGNEGTPSVAVSKLLNPYWSDSFEDPTFANWTQSPPGLNGTLIISNLQFVTGTRSLRANYTDTTRVSGPTVQRATPTTTELYARWWMQASPGITWGSPYTTLGVFGGGTTAPIISLVTNDSVSGAPYFVVQTAKEASYGNESLPQNQGTPATIGNSWVCYETRYKLNTPGVANGILQFWAGGVLKADYQNREFIGTSTSDPAPSNAAFTFVRLYNDRGNGNLYLDDLQISNARLGCAATTPPPVNPIVIAPSNLRFQTGTAPVDLAIDTTAILTPVYSNNTTSGAITIGAGTFRGLLCASYARDVSAADLPVTSFILGAQNFTFIRRDSGGGHATEWWWLVNPSSGAGTVTVTTTGTVNQLSGSCVAVTGMKASDPIVGHTGTVDLTNTVLQPSTQLTNLVQNAWIFDAIYSINEYGLTVGAGQTQRDNRTLSEGGFIAAVGSSSVGPLAASINQTMQWTQTAPAMDRSFSQSVIAVAPEPGTGGTNLVALTDNSSDETGFQWEWKHEGLPTYTLFATTGAGVTTTLSPITTQTQACIRARAIRNSDVSEYATELCQVPPTTPPPDPGDPVVTPPPGPTAPPPVTPQPIPETTSPSGKLHNGVTVLAWPTPNTTDATKSRYQVEWTNQTYGETGWRVAGLTADGATGFVHHYTPFVPAGESRFWVCYRVKALTSAGASSYGPTTCGDVDVFVPLSPPSVQIPAAPGTIVLQ